MKKRNIQKIVVLVPVFLISYLHADNGGLFGGGGLLGTGLGRQDRPESGFIGDVAGGTAKVAGEVAAAPLDVVGLEPVGDLIYPEGGEEGSYEYSAEEMYPPASGTEVSAVVGNYEQEPMGRKEFRDQGRPFKNQRRRRRATARQTAEWADTDWSNGDEGDIEAERSMEQGWPS